MTTTLEGGEGSESRPGRFIPPGTTRYPLYRRLGGPQGRSGQVRKILPQPGFDPRTVQPVAIRYTDYATRPPVTTVLYKNFRAVGNSWCLLLFSSRGRLARSAIVHRQAKWCLTYAKRRYIIWIICLNYLVRRSGHFLCLILTYQMCKFPVCY